MSETTAVQSAPPRKEIRNDRLLSLKDVEEITGMCSRVASELMNETGGAFMLRNQKFVFESAFYDFLREQIARGGDA